MQEKTQQALQHLHAIRSNEMYRQQNRQRTHLNAAERQYLDYAIKMLQELLEMAGV
jgi:hypothetical protein